MENITLSVLLLLSGLLLGIVIVYFINYLKGNAVDSKIEKLLEKARKDAENTKREALLETKEEIHNLKLNADKEIKERKNEVRLTEEKMLQRENNIDRRDQTLSKREQLINDKEQNLVEKQSEIQDEKVKIEELKKEQLDLLTKISSFSKEKAKDLVMKRVEEELSRDIASYIKDRESEAKLEADKKAKNLLVNSMQRYSNDVANELTVTVVNLPNDEMKGRIIGREGRNIRTIEAVTGVDLIIDDTPEAIVLSSYDPYRRETARVMLETLIKDGRIHPARIEELYAKTLKEMKAKVLEYGENACYELGLSKVDSNLVEIIGKLHFRTSYGQNALQHSKEVAHFTGLLAQELGENVMLAKRAGLLHDIGKAIDFEVEGSHVEIGMDLAKKYKEDDVVINSIASHHGDTEATSIISVLVEIADTLSAARPGARNDSAENYIKRLEQLENISKDFEGVDKAFAMQAGRELRVIVKPDKLDDLASYKVAKDIKDKIEEEMQYPGTIKVTVIRETRAIEEAK